MTDLEYAWGYLVAASSAAYFTMESVEGHSARFTITKFPGADSRDIRRRIMESLNDRTEFSKNTKRTSWHR